jgi:hypothetical protein
LFAQRVVPLFKEVIRRLPSVIEHDDMRCYARAAKILFDEERMAGIIFDQENSSVLPFVDAHGFPP